MTSINQTRPTAMFAVVARAKQLMDTGHLLEEEKESIFESVAYLHKPEDTLNIGYKYDAGR